jgi:hypothetical protein
VREAQSRVESLESIERDVTQGRVADLRRNTDRYLKDWEADAGQIENALLQQRSLERREAARAALDRLLAAAQRSQTAADPFMRSLMDIRLYLRRNLTPEGIREIADIVQQARTSGASVQQAYDEMLIETNRMRTLFSPVG